MTIFLIILGSLLFAGSIASLVWRISIAPALSYLGLLTIGLTTRNGYPLLPVNTVILTTWFCMTLVVTLAVMLQAPAVRAQTRGVGYIVTGALAGLALSLLATSFSSSVSILYTVMVISVIIGISLGFLLYTRTPEGRPVQPGSGNFLRYLLAKGFPTAITVMQAGVVLVLTVAVNRL